MTEDQRDSGALEEHAPPGTRPPFNVQREPIHEDTVRAYMALGSLGLLGLLTVAAMILIWVQPERNTADVMVVLTPLGAVTSLAAGFFFATKSK